MLAIDDFNTRFVTDLMSNLSLKLVNTGSILHNIDNKYIWIDTIDVENRDKIKSFYKMLPNFPSMK